MDLRARLHATFKNRRPATWKQFAWRFIGVFGGVGLGLYAFVLLMDPYNNVPFSLPIERPLVSIHQRYMYPQIARSKQFDSFIIGTSTSRLIDPEILNQALGARFANLGMDAATAWEQTQIGKLFIRHSGAKFVIVGGDDAWCSPDADRHRITYRGFPDFLYDENRWNDLLYLMNAPAVELSGRLVGYHLGIQPEASRYDGYQVFVPPDETYDAAKAQNHIWGNRPRVLPPPDTVPPALSDIQISALKFPALAWLDELFAAVPQANKTVAWMPVHIAAQAVPGSVAAAISNLCKARVLEIARKYGAKVIDWRIASSLTATDTNYWDSAHYRVPVAQQLSRDLGRAIRDGTPSPDQSYRIVAK